MFVTVEFSYILLLLVFVGLLKFVMVAECSSHSALMLDNIINWIILVSSAILWSYILCSVWKFQQFHEENVRYLSKKCTMYFMFSRPFSIVTPRYLGLLPIWSVQEGLLWEVGKKKVKIDKLKKKGIEKWE